VKLSRFKPLLENPETRTFLSGMLIFGIAAGLTNGVLNNFLYDVLRITRVERGIVEFPRELPGLLLFALVALLYRLSELRIMYVALLVSMVGLAGLVFAGTHRVPAIALIVLWSTGEHLLMPLRQSMAIHLAGPGKEGLAMGGVSSLGNIGTVAGFYLVPLLLLAVSVLAPGAPAFTGYATVFAAGAVVLLAALLLFSRVRDRGERIRRERLQFKRKFVKYYMLEMFFGARKQVFITFAPYVLIMSYGAGPALISSLNGITSIGNIAFGPALGRLMDRVGYKRIIMIDAALQIPVCLCYGFAQRLLPQPAAYAVICVVFVLDALLFAVGMARALYVKTLSSSQDEVTSTLSTGISINHLVSIMIAVAGGLLWEVLGTEALFSIAAFFGLCSFAFALTVPGPDKARAAAEAADRREVAPT
jgi:predicted MFS family arabinose efflux permease